MAIGLSHGGSDVYAATEGSRQLWVGTQDGLVLFERGADGWREHSARCAANTSARSSSKKPAARCSPGAFFGSIHASADGGKTWDGRDNGLTTHDVYSLASHVVDGKVARLCRHPTRASIRQRRIGNALE